MTTENESPDLRRYREEWDAMTARVQALEGERDMLRTLLLEGLHTTFAQFATLRYWTERADMALNPQAPGGAKVDVGA